MVLDPNVIVQTLPPTILAALAVWTSVKVKSRVYTNNGKNLGEYVEETAERTVAILDRLDRKDRNDDRWQREVRRRFDRQDRRLDALEGRDSLPN